MKISGRKCNRAASAWSCKDCALMRENCANSDHRALVAALFLLGLSAFSRDAFVL